MAQRAVNGIAPWAESVPLVFLIGCPRSGTTWLQAMLAAHPAVYSGPETHFFTTLSLLRHEAKERDRNSGLAVYWTHTGLLDMLRGLFRATISSLPEPPAPPAWFLEKSPGHTQHVETMLEVFPEARVIHIIRDARSVVASMVRVRKLWPFERWWIPAGIAPASSFWKSMVLAGRQAAHRVSAPNHYIELRYESLRADPAAELTRLWAWLGLGTDEALARRVAADNTRDRVIERGLVPPLPRPVCHGTPAKIEGFVGEAPGDGRTAALTPLQRRRVEHVVGDLLRELGYPVDSGRMWPWERLVTSTRVRSALGLPQF